MLIKHIKDIVQGKTRAGCKRSSKWSSVRKKHLEKYPKCAVCGGTKKVEVHHKKPYHLYPELELDPENLISLCEDWSYGVCCHLLIGHEGNYRKVNLSVIQDAEYWSKKLINK